MDQLTTQLSPYRVFTRNEWAKLRADTPLTLSAEEVEELRGVNDRVNLDEVVAIYLPLSRLLNLYVAASQDLFKVTQKFLGGNNHKVPYIIGIAGSVAGGKSTTARILETSAPPARIPGTRGWRIPSTPSGRPSRTSTAGAGPRGSTSTCRTSTTSADPTNAVWATGRPIGPFRVNSKRSSNVRTSWMALGLKPRQWVGCLCR